MLKPLQTVSLSLVNDVIEDHLKEAELLMQLEILKILVVGFEEDDLVLV